MDWIYSLGNNDCVLNDIKIESDVVVVSVNTWDGKVKTLHFREFHAIKVKNVIGEELGTIKVRAQSTLLEELKVECTNNGGSSEELKDVRSVVFMNAWDNIEILEIICNTTLISEY